MRQMLRAVCLMPTFLMMVTWVAPAQAASAPAPPSPGLTAADARQLVAVLNDPKPRARLITTLSNLAKTAPAAKAAAVAGLAPNSLGADVLTGAGALGGAAARQAAEFEHALHDFREVGPWMRSILGDPVRRLQVLSALARLLFVLAAALLATFACNRLVARPVGVLARWSSATAPELGDEPVDEGAELGRDEEIDRTRHSLRFRRLLHALARLPLALGHLLLELVPVLGFAIVAGLFEAVSFLGNPESRLVVSTALRCFIVAGLLIAVVNTLFAPKSPSLRLVLVSDRVALRIRFWLRLMLLVGAWGFSSIAVMQTLGLSSFASLALAKILMLVEHTLLACLIVQGRRDVARRLQPPRRLSGFMRRVLGAMANRWWVYALVLNYGLWLVWAFDIKNGYTQLWSNSLKMLLVVVTARLILTAVLGGLARGLHVDEIAVEHPWVRARAGRYYPFVRRLVTLGIFGLTMITVLQVWGVNTLSWFDQGALGTRLFSALVGILAALTVGVLIWESANIALDQHLDRLGRDPAGGAAKVARLRTLLPILRIVLSIVLVAIVGLTILSEIGVNIAPLLGGAGIVGVAIGFGSQKLVQDFITGIFLLLENTMQVGDWVTAGGLSGSVEHLSIRTIRLRAGDGSVHIIPFSSVTTVTNTNRGLGNAPVSVDIDPGEDADEAGEVLKQVALTLRDDPDYKDGMLSDLQYWGVDKVTSQAVTLVGQIVCTDKSRYGVQREFNRRMKVAFAEHGIRLAAPTQSVVVLRDAASLEPSRPAIGHDDDGPTTVTESPPTAALGHAQ